MLAPDLARLLPAIRSPRWLRTLSYWRALARSRRALGELTPDRLDDVGLSAEAAAAEAARPFWDTAEVRWDAPNHWRR